MKSIAIVAAVGLWSCTVAALDATASMDATASLDATAASSDVTASLDVATATAAASDVDRRQPKAVGLPSLDEMSRAVEIQAHLMSAASDLIGLFASDTPFDFFGPHTGVGTAVGRGKKQKAGAIAAGMMGAAAMSMLAMKSMGAIMLFIVHSFFATKLGLILAAYLLLCKLTEMKSAPTKSVIKWSPPPPPSVSYDEHSQMMLGDVGGGGGPYPDSLQSSYPDPLQNDLFQQQPPPQQQQQQPSSQYGAPQQQQQQQYMAPVNFGGGSGGGGGGDFMQAHYSNVSPVTYRPQTIVKSAAAADNAAKSTAGRL